MNILKRYITLILLTLLVIPICSGNNIPSIAKGDYESGWTYDANGNRTADPSRGITSITYNYLNQPKKITFEDGSYIEHLYRSDGTMCGRNERTAVLTTINGSTTPVKTYHTKSYTKVGDFELEGLQPYRLYIDGGYIDIDFSFGLTYYRYYVYDHQGSVRAVLNTSGTVIQSTDYSAYGVPSTRYQMNADNRFHLGLQWQPMKGLYGYYNNARFRDALLAGTFLQQDPLAEKYYPFSPYHYGMNNPLKFMDTNGKWIMGNDGKAIDFNIDNNGNINWSKNIKDDTKLILNAMMKTNIGHKQVNKMLNSEHPIYIFISNTEGFGNTGRTTTSFHRKGNNTTITNASIEINIHDIQKYGDSDKELKYLSKEDRIGTVGVHESEHATNPQAIANAREDKSSNAAEKIANLVTNQHIEELNIKKDLNH